MTTLRTKLEESAFWHGMTCLQCGETVEEGEGEQPCGCCGGTFVDSQELLALIKRSEQEDEVEGPPF